MVRGIEKRCEVAYIWKAFPVRKTCLLFTEKGVVCLLQCAKGSFCPIFAIHFQVESLKENGAASRYILLPFEISKRDLSPRCLNQPLSL
jgi:hypothetical protein